MAHMHPNPFALRLPKGGAESNHIPGVGAASQTRPSSAREAPPIRDEPVLSLPKDRSEVRRRAGPESSQPGGPGCAQPGTLDRAGHVQVVAPPRRGTPITPSLLTAPGGEAASAVPAGNR